MINKTSIERLSNSLKATIEVWAEENGLERTGKFNIVFDEHSFRVSSSLEFVEASAKEDVAAKSYKDGLYALNLKDILMDWTRCRFIFILQEYFMMEKFGLRKK